jgi:hypothetical protein
MFMSAIEGHVFGALNLHGLGESPKYYLRGSIRSDSALPLRFGLLDTTLSLSGNIALDALESRR